MIGDGPVLSELRDRGERRHNIEQGNRSTIMLCRLRRFSSSLRTSSLIMAAGGLRVPLPAVGDGSRPVASRRATASPGERRGRRDAAAGTGNYWRLASRQPRREEEEEILQAEAADAGATNTRGNHGGQRPPASIHKKGREGRIARLRGRGRRQRPIRRRRSFCAFLR